MKVRFILPTLLIFVAFSAHTNPLQAASGDTIVEGIGTIEILQEGPDRDLLGNWTLIQPDNSRVTLNKKESYINDAAPSGQYTLLIEKAEGTSTRMELHKNGQLVSTGNTPTATFTLSKDDIIIIKAFHTLTHIGQVSVSSDPNGIDFILEGPNGMFERGVTPISFEGVSIGMYSVTYKLPEGCPQPKAQSNILTENGRVGFDIKLSCEILNQQRQEEQDKQLKFVTMMVGGNTVILEDAPISAWFAPYVHTVAKTGIMSGYKDKQGNYTGKFGPSDPVSIAQLVKVAHEVAGINESEARGTLKNGRARDTWFEQYYLSAETLGWQVFFDTKMNPGRYALRGEVISTLLQALDVPRIWPKGEIFRDVSPQKQYASSIETAALDGIINSDSGIFRPDDFINRAELSKIITLAIDKYIKDSPEFTGTSH